MQTLRKKTSPLKYKNETSRFLGEGVSFKAKLIGILEVSEARGDRMCQEALSDLKTAIRAAGEHKQRITINVAIDGLRLRDEKTGDSLYHHPVHKISFIAQDMTDSRAFGYIFGSPDTGHRFFGIKTDKAASQVVIAMRDLFQVVFALKKKEVEIAKQHLDKNRFGSSLFSETTLSGSKVLDLTTEANKISSCDSKINTTNADFSTPAVADLVDLEFELNSLQQGLHQMERITPSEIARCKDDPFGDSFTPFPKPILPPPPSSGKERTSRVPESSSLFSPKTPQTGKSDDSSTLDSSSFFFTPKNNLSHNFNVLHNKSNNSDWFTPSTNNSFFEDQPLTSEQTKPQCQDHHEKKKQEILSHFDVFTDLDPLGTGKIKPYVDKKHFFQELKNPPKKILNDLVVESQSEATGKNSTSPIFPATFDLSTSLSTTTTTTTTIITNMMNNNNSISSVSVGNDMLTSADVSKTNNTSTCLNLFPVDPFGEDPFVRNDPFVETDFAKQDPFDSELSIFNRDQQKDKVTDYMEQFKLFTKSPADASKIMSCLEKHMSLDSVLPRYNATRFNKENSFNVHFDQKENTKSDHLSELHENHSLDLSSESECAPEPPPRPTSNISQTIPPPLPPKKQPGETCVKPPPRPPHSDFDSRYDYIETYETAPNSLELAGTEVEESPPLPVPARKTKLDNDFGRAMNKLKISAADEDYLTPVSIPKAKEGLVLLPPPQKSNRKNNITPNNLVQVTVSSYLDTKPNIVSQNTTTGEKNVLDDGFDITLSQLTISGLNDLAMKLDISTAQLSNMTVAQFSTYLSNFIRNKSSDTSTESGSVKSKNNVIFPADFANFSNFNIKTGDTYDRYAVFRELFEEEIKQAGFNSEAKNKNYPESIEEINSISHVNDTVGNNESNDENTTLVDKYAALREMVAIEKSDTGKSIDEQNNLDENTGNEDRNDLSEKRLHEKNVEVENKTNIINAEHVDNKLITYNVSMDITNDTVATVNLPAEEQIISEIIDNRPTSGSLSDIVSGSSPEIDNTGSNSEVAKKINDTTGESWAIFDQLNSTGELSRDKQNIQSEEGVSPWSSDSKEFGNDGSPPDWDLRNDSGSGGDQRWSQRKRDTDGGGWWDTSAEPEVQYYPATSANRRSTDSYDDECYECYEKPRRRRQCWTTSGGQVPVEVGGHSSSSRDVSPWEEEPSSKEDYRDSRQTWTSKHTGGRQYSSERHRDKRNNDSWDEEDDYEYEEEHCNRFYWHGAERHSDGNAEHNHWSSDWKDDTRQHFGRRRRNVDSREHWCCPDWNGREIDEPVGRYNGRRSDIPLSSKRRDRDRYYSRDSQDSPWEDEYSNDAEESGGSGLTFHYSTARRSWKRPNSASEMDRKIGEMKPRQGLYHLGTGGSDGERDKRYKSGRRSKSRESPFLDIFYNRHKSDAVTLRSRSKYHHQKMGHFESDYLPQEMVPIKKGCDVVKALSQDHPTGKKSSAAGHRKKTKEGQKTEEFGRKCLPPATKSPQSPFENDFVTAQTENPSVTVKIGKRFSFEKEFETSEADSPTINSRSSKTIGVYSKVPPKLGSKSTSSKSYQFTHRSPFEDDFSPTEKSDTLNSPTVSATKEDQRSTLHKDEHESFGNFRSRGNEVSKRVLKSRISDNVDNLKKSESVNIFARENDPFDDEFFSCTNIGEEMSIEICSNGGSKSKISPRTDSKWTEQFQNFDSK